MEIFEIKHDGFRAIAHLESGKARLVSRRGNLSKSFLDLCESLAWEVDAQAAILDGEIVCVDSTGRSDFRSLLYRRKPVHFYAFNLLSSNGRDVRRLPLVKHKERLRRIIPPQPAPLLYVDHLDARGVDLFR
jgi:bifunctional non-homologous end joining protein LigD